MINLKNNKLLKFAVLTSIIAMNPLFAEEKYNTEHESLSSYEVPQWYIEGKLGFFMHLSAF